MTGDTIIFFFSWNPGNWFNSQKNLNANNSSTEWISIPALWKTLDICLLGSTWSGSVRNSRCFLLLPQYCHPSKIWIQIQVKGKGNNKGGKWNLRDRGTWGKKVHSTTHLLIYSKDIYWITILIVSALCSAWGCNVSKEEFSVLLPDPRRVPKSGRQTHR